MPGEAPEDQGGLDRALTIYTIPSAARAHTVAYGLGCGPAHASIRSTNPVLNKTAAVSGSGPAGVPGVALLGFPQDAGPLVLSAPCALNINLLAPTASLGTFASPAWAINLGIPNAPSLLGGTVAVQAFYAYGTPILAASSNGVSLVIGN